MKGVSEVILNRQPTTSDFSRLATWQRFGMWLLQRWWRLGVVNVSTILQITRAESESNQSASFETPPGPWSFPSIFRPLFLSNDEWQHSTLSSSCRQYPL